MPPCGAPVFVSCSSLSSVRTPDFKNALTSASTRLSPIRTRTRCNSAECEISSKHALISPSTIHSYERLVKRWISAIASWARRSGRKPYENGWNPASKIGSSTSLRAAWTTRSRTAAMPKRRRLVLPGFGIVT